MATVKDLKDKLIAYLDSVDFSKMSTSDINGYVSVLKALDDMEKPSPFEAIARVPFSCFPGNPMPVEEGDNG